MGASEFFTPASGKDVKEAFANAVSHARHEYGHGGYTGTIAEKHDYKSASSEIFESVVEATVFAESKIDDENHWCQDKWGPAGYVKYKKGEEIRYLFFGVASD